MLLQHAFMKSYFDIKLKTLYGDINGRRKCHHSVTDNHFQTSILHFTPRTPKITSDKRLGAPLTQAFVL